MPDYQLGRIWVPDERDAYYPMSLHLPEVPPKLPTSKFWRGQLVRLNQGQTPDCVGFTGANWMGHLPIADKVTNQTGTDLYQACKAIDGFPNEQGTYDRALAQVLVAQGRFERYLWAQSIDELRTWILTTGPVMVGSNWYEGMFNPDAKHVLHITGKVAGGHEWLVKGFKSGMYRMRNSWGPNWGDRGEAWISEADLARLVFAEVQGDALGAVERRP